MSEACFWIYLSSRYPLPNIEAISATNDIKDYTGDYDDHGANTEAYSPYMQHIRVSNMSRLLILAVARTSL